jgi:hypothetical protein
MMATGVAWQVQVYSSCSDALPGQKQITCWKIFIGQERCDNALLVDAGLLRDSSMCWCAAGVHNDPLSRGPAALRLVATSAIAS